MFAKFMNKKDFHPGSKANIRRVWIAEQKKEAEQAKQRELKEQYVREQDKFLNRQLVSNDEKLKLGLNFMYDVPPGYNKDKEKDDTKEEEVRFEWQKGAPREAYAKNIEARDQPFGIPVRNVKCIKCGKWGHVNTDRECPLFNKSNKSEVDPSAITDVADPLKLMQDMRSEGLALKQSVMGRVFNPDDPNQQLVASDEEQEDPEAAFLASLTDKQKRKLLRKLDKLEKKEEDEAREVRKQEKKKKKSRRGDRSNSSDSEDECLQDRSSRHREKRSRHPDSDEEENRKGRTHEDRSKKVDYNSMKDRDGSCSGSGWEVERKKRRENREKPGEDQPREKRRREQPLSQPGTEGQDHRRRERGAYNERDFKERKPRKSEREQSSSRSDSVEERRERNHRDNYKRKDNKECKTKTHTDRSSSVSDVNNEKYEKSGKQYFDSRDEKRDVAVSYHRKRSTSNQDGQDRYLTSGDDKNRRQRKGERDSDSHTGHDDSTSRHRSACRKHQHKEKRR